MNHDVEPIVECVACGKDDLELIFDLAQQPLANSYKHSANDPEATFPLALNSCKHCRHLQLTHKINPHLLFKNYAYMSSVSRTTVEFFEWFATWSLSYFEKSPSTVLDIGCNDGSQLDIYKRLGLQTHGVDPATTLSAATSQRHRIVCDFFKASLFAQQFDLITVQNAFAHNSNQLELLINIKKLMTPTSVLCVVTSHAHMLTNGEFDTIYHEHISFYNIQSMKKLCDRAGLYLIDVMNHPIHGGSYLFVISCEPKNISHVDGLIAQEREQGLYGDQILQDFSNKVAERVSQAKQFLTTCEQQKIPIVGYGAPAKSSVFLNYSGIRLNYIIEDTPLKQGTWAPGTNIPIVGPQAFEQLADQPTVCWLILAWNFYDEIKQKIQMLRPNNTDLFVRYLPKLQIDKSK